MIAMATHQLKLPLVDFTKVEEQGLVPGTLEWNNVRDQVKLALQEVGSFEAVFGEIVPIGARESMIGVVRDVFCLPLESGKAGFVDLCDEMYRGYVREANQFYRSFGVDNMALDAGVERLCKWLWPEGAPPRLRGIIQLYAEKLSGADQLIRKMVLESLGCEKYWNEHLDSAHYHFRWNKYEATGKAESKLLLRAHTDKSFLSILYQNGVDGLEIQTKDGEWKRVQQQLNSFVVLLGDSFRAWSNGRLHSPKHRVTIRGSEARYSIAMFAMPKARHVIRAPNEVVSEEHPLLYGPCEIGAYLAFYRSYAGQDELKSYCGLDQLPS